MAKKINKKATSILDGIQQEPSKQSIAQKFLSASTDDSPIVLTSPIQEQLGDDFVNRVTAKNRVKTTSSIKSLLANIPQSNQQTPNQQTPNQQTPNQQQILHQQIQDVVIAEEVIVDNEITVDEVQETLESVVKHDSLEHIPDIDNDNIDKLVITKTGKSNKSFIKTKITVRTPDATHRSDLQNMLSYLKIESGGSIRHRICDLRLIGNTNKTQLKDSDLKLLKNSYTIKPVGGVVNKSTRIIISINPDDSSTLIVYMQKSRDKFIAKIELNDNTDWDWLGEWIFNFYETLNFNLFKYRLLNRTYSGDPMYNLIKNIAKIGKFKVTMPKEQTKITRFAFKPIHGLNTHLVFNVIKKTINVGNPLNSKLFNVVVTSDIDTKLYLQLSAKSNSDNTVPFTIEQLNSESFFKSVNEFVNNFSNDEYEIIDIEYDKLTKRKSREALMFLINNNIEVKKILSNDEIVTKLIETGFNPKSDYDAESIIFKHENIEYGILQHLAINTGKDERGYKNRLYRFKLIYGINGAENEIVDKDYKALLRSINVID